MRRALFFIVAISFAATSFASIPRASMLDRASDHASAFAQPLPETRVWASEVLAPFERPPMSALTRALHQGYGDVSTTNAYGLGRFLSVDPVIGKSAVRSPQLWNRYAYVGNNPLKFTDPTGRVLQLSGCVKDQSSDACKGQMNLYLSTFGSQSADAAKYLQVGKNGIVSFNGISGAAFAARFGQMGQATNYLVSNNAAMFTMMTGRSGKTIEGRGAYFDPTKVSTLFHGEAYPGGGEIGIDTGAFPQNFFGVTSSATEALVHEIGHAVGSLFPGYASSVDLMAAGSSLMRMGSTGRMEAYATSFENAWRRGVLGASTLRRGYFYDGDVRDIGNTPLFP
jgi:hypothetical protein